MSRGNGGRVGRGDGSGEMKKITFRVDAETEAALNALEAQMDKAVHGRRSALLRKLVMEAFAQLSQERR